MFRKIVRILTVAALALGLFVGAAEAGWADGSTPDGSGTCCSKR